MSSNTSCVLVSVPVSVPGSDGDLLAKCQVRRDLLGPAAEVLAGLRGVDTP
jgi:hypothetical protein